MTPQDPCIQDPAASGNQCSGLLAGIFCLLTLLIGVCAGARADIIPLDEITPGMTGYGLTVFAGSTVDTFGVTVIGVQDRTRVAGSMILVEVSGHDLSTSGIAQGMSGSPVFLDGRLAGALAVGWGGALRPIAGVTPAAEMLAMPTEPVELAAATPSAPGKSPLPVGPDAGRAVAQALGWAVSPPGQAVDSWPDADQMLQDLLPELKWSGAPGGLPPGWVCRLPGENIEALASGDDQAENTPLVPGAACAIPLVTGDALLGVIGTTTWVDGDDVFLMGHPFMQRGPVRWPLATARVLTVLPSRQMSFKMAGIGAVVGTVYHDQRSGMTGKLGPGPRLVPVAARVSSPQDNRTYQFAVANDPSLTPALVFWCLYNSLLVQGDDASQQTIGYTVTSHWTGDLDLEHDPLVLTGVATGPGGAQGLAAALMAPLAMLQNNRERRLRLTGVEAAFSLERPAALATISGLETPRAAACGGGPLTCTVTLQPRRGPAQNRTLVLPIPSDLPPGLYRLVAANAEDLFALEIQRRGSPPPVDTVRDLVQLLRSARSADQLVVALVAPSGGVVVRGREMPALPDSKARLLAAGDLTLGHPLAELPSRVTLPVPWALRGSIVRNLILESDAGSFTSRPRP